MRFIFKTELRAGHPPRQARRAASSGTRRWLLALLLACHVLGILAGAADLHPHLRHRRPRADAAVGFTGQFSLGHAPSWAWAPTRRRLLTGASVPFAGAHRRGRAVGAVGVIVGLPALRLKGIYLGIATHGLRLHRRGGVRARWESVTGGNAGKHGARSRRPFGMPSTTGEFYFPVRWCCRGPRWASSTCCARPPGAPSSPSATRRSRRRAWASTWRASRRCRSRSRRR